MVVPMPLEMELQMEETVPLIAFMTEETALCPLQFSAVPDIIAKSTIKENPTA